MGNLRACLVVAIMALAACGNDHGNVDGSVTVPDAPPDAKVFMDAPAPMFDFSCATNPAPTAATAQITLSGTAQLASQGGATPIDAATVEACRAGTTCAAANRLATDTTDAAGAFSLGPISTSSMPLDAYLRLTKTGVRTTMFFPPQPVQADFANIPVISIPDNFFAACSQSGTTTGTMAVAVSDCANNAITDSANIMLVLKQGGSPITVDVFDLGSVFPQAAGTFLVCNVPANDVTNLGATYNGMQLRAIDVRIVGNTTSVAVLRPGYF